MLILKITQENETVLDTVDYLNQVATEIKDGFSKGEGWELSGEPEDFPAEED